LYLLTILLTGSQVFPRRDLQPFNVSSIASKCAPEIQPGFRSDN